MKNSLWIILIIGILLVGGAIFYNYSTNNNSKLDYIAKSENSNLDSNINEDSSYIAEKSNNIIKQNEEKEISYFTTPIKDKEKDRITNISLTIAVLNNTIIEPGQTFSFNDTVGKSSSQKGYQEADTYSHGKIVQGMGGGKCQVSTTLYNATLAIPELEIVERHEHSGNVTYIDDGKDAAVSYGSQDFKFKNNLSNKIKIKAENTENDVTIRIFEIK